MRHFDHDGKSKTSSAVDWERYPRPGAELHLQAGNAPTQREIAALAYQIWERHGRPHGSHERDWFEAEHQLKTKADVPVESRILAEQAGSVQR